MSWWSFSYLALFLGLSVAGLVDDIGEQSPLVYLIGGISAGAVVVYFYLANWIASLRILPRNFAFSILGMGVIWNLVEFWNDKRSLSREQAAIRPLAKWGPFALMLLLVLPAFYFAGLGAEAMVQ